MTIGLSKSSLWTSAVRSPCPPDVSLTIEVLRCMLELERTGALRNENRFEEAAKVLLDYAKDVAGAVEALCAGADFAEAVRLVRSSLLLL